MRRFLTTLLWLLLVASFNAHAEEAPKRVALLIGNSAYSSVPTLQNPANDAVDLGAALQRLNFQVTVATNLANAEMNRVLGEFAAKTRDADMAVIFFAGHGVEIDNRNYMIPTDAQINHIDDISFQAVPLDHFLKAVEGAEKLRLVLLDACRNNPFNFQTVNASRSLGRGLSRVEPPGGVLVGYAARGGTVAYDGKGQNSPYTKALLQYVEEPGLEIGKFFRRVRDAVYTETEGYQEPFTYGSLPSRDIFLAGIARYPMVDDFNKASSSGDLESWDNFLTKYQSNTDNLALLSAARKLREATARLQNPTLVPQDVEPRSSRTSVLTLPPIVTPEEAEQSLDLSVEERRQIQRYLASLGYKPGPDDGVFGRKTRIGLSKFQKNAGIEDTGFATKKTLSEIVSAYDAAPKGLDGRWRFSLERKSTKAHPKRNDYAGLVYTMGFVDFAIKGRIIEITKTANLSNAPNPKDPDMRATLTRKGRLDVSVVVNYRFFRNDYRRVLVSIELPDRVLAGQEFVLPGRHLDATYRFQGRLRRVSAD